MLDENMKVWLLEINSNPALQTHCDVLKEVVPTVVKDALHISIECFEKSRHQKCLLPLHGLEDLSAFLFCQRSNRYARFNFDETPITNKVSGDLGLPSGWNLIYSESQAAFRARWPMSQSSSLRGWIPPRYKPSVNHNASSCQRTNDGYSEQNGGGRAPLQGFGSTVSVKETTHLTAVTNDTEVTYATGEHTTSQNNTTGNLSFPRVSFPEYRTFEYSLRRYPVVPNTTNNARLVRRSTVTSHSFKKPNQPINLEDVIEKTSEMESLISLSKPNRHNITVNSNSRSDGGGSGNGESRSNSCHILSYKNRITKQLSSNSNSSNTKHELDVFSEDEILTGKLTKKRN
ncbi:unnamed protein product [Heterobilharzia americana]|nr:unnamed protein product [Heterobilharzia americana]